MQCLASVFDEAGYTFHRGEECASGPLGGDAQISAQIIMQNIGAIIFFEVTAGKFTQTHREVLLGSAQRALP